MDRNWVRKEPDYKKIQRKNLKLEAKNFQKNQELKEKTGMSFDWSRSIRASKIEPLTDSPLDWKKGKDGVIFRKSLKRRKDLKDGRKTPQMKKRKPEPLKVPKNSLIDVPTNRSRRLHDKIDLDIIMGKQSHGIVGAKLKRSYFKPKEDLVLFHVKVASSVLMEGVLGIQERFFNYQYRTFLA